MSSAQAFEAMMRVPSSSWLPKKWSPFACVLTSAPISFAAGTARRMASSISRV